MPALERPVLSSSGRGVDVRVRCSPAKGSFLPYPRWGAYGVEDDALHGGIDFPLKPVRRRPNILLNIEQL